MKRKCDYKRTGSESKKSEIRFNIIYTYRSSGLTIREYKLLLQMKILDRLEKVREWLSQSIKGINYIQELGRIRKYEISDLGKIEIPR